MSAVCRCVGVIIRQIKFIHEKRVNFEKFVKVFSHKNGSNSSTTRFKTNNTIGNNFYTFVFKIRIILRECRENVNKKLKSVKILKLPKKRNYGKPF